MAPVLAGRDALNAMSPLLLMDEHSKPKGKKPSLALSATLVKVYTSAKAGAAHTIHSVSAAKTPTVPQRVRCLMVLATTSNRTRTQTDSPFAFIAFSFRCQRLGFLVGIAEKLPDV